MDLAAIAEVTAIDRLVRSFARHPQQVNRPHGSDAELLSLGSDRYLAATMDAVTSEISVGLYQDGFTVGWVLVMANMSDLAAVGASPLGLLNALNLSPRHDDEWRARLVQGMDAAARELGIHVLGGDLNEATETSVTGCAFGLVEVAKPVTRFGLRPGDHLYVTGRFGLGNAYATAFLSRKAAIARELEGHYRPVARLKEGQELLSWASAMMDTSDGLMSTLDHLARLNEVGLDLAFDLERQASDLALDYARRMGIPLWPLMCGEHGDYELVFAIPEERHQAFKAAERSWQPVYLGRASDAPDIRLIRPDVPPVSFDGSFVRNLLDRVHGDWSAYVREFWAYGEQLGL